ncbi:MAG: alpha/beta fold hydrolase [Streptosporangiales bacterium]|nr:alpha/beta fold hydrolase [Streptosporangiales bacterium]
MTGDSGAETGGDPSGPRWARAVTRRLTRRARDVARLLAATQSTTIGSGTDVVIVPGLAVSRYLKPPQWRIATFARAHLVELPGVGDAPNAGGALTLHHDAATLTAWLRTHIDGAYVLVGHSYGTQVVLRAAAASDERLRAVVLASPTVDPAYRTMHRLLGRWLISDRREPRELHRSQLPDARHADLRRVTAMLVSMLTDAPEHWASRIAAPLTVVMGERDLLARPAWGRQLTRRPGGMFVAVAGGTHSFPFTRPDDLAHAVHATIERTDGRDSTRP